MKKTLIILSVLIVLLVSCGAAKSSSDTPQEAEVVSIDASKINDKEIIIAADTKISINNMGSDFLIFSKPQVIENNKGHRFVSKDSKKNKGSVLKTDHNTYIPYPEDNEAVFYGEDLNVRSNEVVKVHARKLKNIPYNSAIIVDENPAKGVNFCTEKTDTFELFEGVISIDLTQFQGNQLKTMILSAVDTGAGTKGFISRSTDVGIIDPSTWETRKKEGYKVLDLTGSGNTLYVYVSLRYDDFDTKSGSTVEQWHKSLEKSQLPTFSQKLLPLKEMQVGTPIDSTTECGYSFTPEEGKKYALKFSDSNKSVDYNDIRKIREKLNTRYYDGSNHPVYIPCEQETSDTIRYIFLGKIPNDKKMYFRTTPFYGPGKSIELIEVNETNQELNPQSFAPEDLDTYIEIDKQGEGFKLSQRYFNSNENDYYLYIEFCSDNQGTPLTENSDKANMFVSVASGYNKIMRGNLIASGSDDQIHRHLIIEDGQYPSSFYFENNTGSTYYVKITKELIQK